jgi:hypothetical protein
MDLIMRNQQQIQTAGDPVKQLAYNFVIFRIVKVMNIKEKGNVPDSKDLRSTARKVLSLGGREREREREM